MADRRGCCDVCARSLSLGNHVCNHRKHNVQYAFVVRKSPRFIHVRADSFPADIPTIDRESLIAMSEEDAIPGKTAIFSHYIYTRFSAAKPFCFRRNLITDFTRSDSYRVRDGVMFVRTRTPPGYNKCVHDKTHRNPGTKTASFD